MDIVKGNMGWIEVIVGPMFSGKSEELIRRLRRAEIGKQRVQIFKPVIDQRYSKNGIVSHSGLEIMFSLVCCINRAKCRAQSHFDERGGPIFLPGGPVNKTRRGQTCRHRIILS